MFKKLEEINTRPKPFEVYTAEELWTNEHTSEQMLAYHLNENIDVSSRKKSFIESSVKWIADYFDLGSEKQIADFGCGPGLYTTRFARLGANVTGIDFSKRSIEYARGVADEEGLSIHYINGNYLSCSLDGRFDLIIMIMCDFCALSPQQCSMLLEKFREHLVPGGYILLDVYSLNAFQKREEVSSYELNQLNGFWSPRKYYGFVNTFKYNDEKVILDKYTIITVDEEKTVYNWLQHYSIESLEAIFHDHGLKVIEKYANVAGENFFQNSHEFAIVAEVS